MSDVEELLRTMGAHTDQVDPRPPSEIRRTGTKRQRRRRGAWGALLVVACLVASGGIVSLVNRALPPVAPTIPPSIGPLRQIGSGITFADGRAAGRPLTTIRGNRAFAAWQQGDYSLAAGAIDLATGQEVWRHHENVTGIWFTLTGTDEVILGVYRVQDAGPRQQVIAFDAASGAVLWRDGFSREIMRFGDVVVIDRNDELLGLDIRTGKQVWALHMGQSDANFVTPMTSSRDGGDPANPRYDNWTDHRIVVVHLGGSVRFVDTDTGRVTHETTVDVNGKLVSLGAVDGSAIVGDDRELMMISSDGQTSVYTAQDGEHLTRAAPCGAGRLCVAEQLAEGYLVTVVEVAGKRVLWQTRSTTFPFASAGFGFYFISTNNDIRVFDSSGTSVRSFDTQTEWPLIVGPDLVIHLRGKKLSQESSALPVEVAIGALTSQSSIPIGNLNVYFYACTPTTTTLVCPTDTGIRVWRFR